MDLEWSETLDDGGVPITGYHIESKIKGEEDEWQLWETVDSNRTKASIKTIQKGKEYQFRIVAINKAGKSDPSHPSRSKEALPKSRKFKACKSRNLVRNSMRKIKFDSSRSLLTLCLIVEEFLVNSIMNLVI